MFSEFLYWKIIENSKGSLRKLTTVPNDFLGFFRVDWGWRFWKCKKKYWFFNAKTMKKCRWIRMQFYWFSGIKTLITSTKKTLKNYVKINENQCKKNVTFLGVFWPGNGTDFLGNRLDKSTGFSWNFGSGASGGGWGAFWSHFGGFGGSFGCRNGPEMDSGGSKSDPFWVPGDSKSDSFWKRVLLSVPGASVERKWS